MMRLISAALPAAALIACTPAAEAPPPAASAAPVPVAAPETVDHAPQGITAMTLPELADAIRSGEISSEAAVQAYLDRMDLVDTNGPTLQSVLALNPNALADARARDTAQAAGETLGPLHGVPILLKDNVESLDPLPTTAGALALKDNVTGRDSPLVAGLRADGAVILGKTNLSQWANYRSRGSISGWTALGGQVRNPHMLDRSPCGSSSGSGAAAAASLAAGTVGTETNGSIICPSNANGIVGFKPTVGLVSQQYIVPISSSQDTAGPMTKTVRGAAMMLNAMATGDAKTDYVAGLEETALAGVRVGVMKFTQGSNADIIDLFEQAVEDVKAAGADVVIIESFETGDPNYGVSSGNVLSYEFKATLNAYLAEAADAVPVANLDELIAFNKEHADVELALFDQSLFEASAERGDLTDPTYLESKALVQSVAGERGIDAMLTQFNVEVLMAPSGPVASRVDPINGDVWPSWAGAGWMAAVAGYPNITVPMGDVHGVPVGISFMGAKDTDAAILSYGYAYEQATGHRKDPTFLKDAEDRPEIAAAMQR